MPKLSLWTGRSMQYLEVNGRSWNTVKPHPPASARLVHRAAGNVGSRLVGSRIQEWFLEGINYREDVLSLGYAALDRAVPSKVIDPRKALLLTRAQYEALSPNSAYNYSNLRPDAVWTMTPAVNTDNVWIGVFATGAVTVGAARIGLFYGFVTKLGTTDVYFVGGDSGSLALGLGGNLNAGIGILTGFRTAERMVGFTKNEYGFACSLAGNWGAFYKSVKVGSRMTTPIRHAFATLSKVQNLRIAHGVSKVTSETGKIESRLKLAALGKKLLGESSMRGKLIAAATELDSVETTKCILAAAGTDGNKEALEIIAVGSGVELSVHAGVAQIKFAVLV